VLSLRIVCRDHRSIVENKECENSVTFFDGVVDRRNVGEEDKERLGISNYIHFEVGGGETASQVVPRRRECQRVGWCSACTVPEPGGDRVDPEEEGVQSFFDPPNLSANKFPKSFLFWLLLGAGKGLALAPCLWAGPRNAQRDVSMWMMDHGWQFRRSDESQEPSRMWQSGQGQRFPGCSLVPLSQGDGGW
jgi:hypothetical protein